MTVALLANICSIGEVFILTNWEVVSTPGLYWTTFVYTTAVSLLTKPSVFSANIQDTSMMDVEIGYKIPLVKEHNKDPATRTHLHHLV